MNAEPFSSISPAEIDDRRQKLKRKRQFLRLRGFARLLVIAALALGLVVMLRHPLWVLPDRHAIKVSGNQWLPDETVRSLLELTYPQSLLRLNPEQLAAKLSQTEAIAQAQVRRELIPPGLSIWIQERQPVAIAYPPNTPIAAATRPLNAKQRQQYADKLGLIDAEGKWMGYQAYVAQSKLPPLPTLVVLGQFDTYKDQWATVYAEISRCSVKVNQVDWRDPRNIILITEIGAVHLGSISSRLPEQMVALDRLRHLPEQVGANRIQFINLRDPRSPYVQVP